ncbi:MAG: response regulator [Opitutaceae bacterium]
MPLARLIVHDTLQPDRPRIDVLLNGFGLPLEIRVTSTRSDFVAALSSSRPDLIVCDYSTADLAASEAIRLARQQFTEVPFVVISDIPGEDVAVECMKFGASDYVLRDRTHQLLAIVRGTIERCKQQRDLQRLQGLHEQLFELTPNFVCITRIDGVLEEANPAWSRGTGLERSGWSGKSLSDFVLREDRDVFAAWWKRITRVGASPQEVGTECEVRLLSPLAGERYVAWTASVLTHDQLVYAYGSDITEKRAAEARLRESEARFRAMADSAPVLIWIADASKSRTYCNRPWLDFTGRTLSQEQGQGWLDSVHPDDRSRVVQSYAESFAIRAAFKLEYRIRRHDSTYRWILDHGSPNHDVSGRFVGFIGSSIDISDQHEAESRLTQRAIKQAALAGFGRFALAQHPSEDLMREATRVICDTLRTEVSQVFSLAEETGALTLRAAAGMEISAWPSPMTEPAPEGLQDPFITLSENPEKFPGRETHAGGGFLSGLAVAISNARRPCGFVTVLSRKATTFNRDAIDFIQALANILGTVYQRERAQAALEESEQKLLQSQKMEAVGILAGGVAHDFNNLLTAIRCYGDILNEDLAVSAPDLQPKAGEILKATARASALTRQLLAFSRKQIVQPEILDLNNVVTDLKDLLRSLLSENVVLTVLPSDAPAYFEADRNQIDQVIINLCINARDAMPQGGEITITISSCALPESNRHGLPPGDFVELSLSDTGVGMSAEVQSHLFQPFFTTKPKGRGTGLGLATCAVIVKSSQGAIHFTSRVGEGTTFSVLLPQIPALSFDTSVVEDTTVREGTERILLVEDDEAIRAVTSAILETLGYQIHAVAGGAEALEYCSATPAPVFDLLLTDIVMPYMDGRDLAERIGKLCPGIRVMFMSGYVGDPSILQAVQDAGARFLEKPFTRSSLARKVREALEPPVR